jgi:CRP/FNR family transcriptional regulator, cyclic AMP receptor protein
MAGYDRSLYQMYLSRIPMFSKCSPEQLDVVAEAGEAVTEEDGRDVLTQGDTGRALYVITSGSAQVRRDGKDVARLEVGDYFGELSLFDPSPHDASIVAIGSLSCIVLQQTDFSGVLDKVPELRDALLHGMARRLHELDRSG